MLYTRIQAKNVQNYEDRGHPDRNILSPDEATARFQLLNDAQAQLRGIDRDEPQDEEA